MKRSTALRLLLPTTLVAVSLPAHAVDLYNNLGAAPTPYQQFFLNEVRPGVGLSARFTATSTGAVTSISLPLRNSLVTTPQSFTLALYGDGPSNTRGSLLGSTYSGTTNGSTSFPSSTYLLTLPTDGGPTLTAGSAYWLAVVPAANNLLWAKSNSAQGIFFFDGGYSVETSLTAFSIVSNPVPEPASVAALGLGALALVRRRRVRLA